MVQENVTLSIRDAYEEDRTEARAITLVAYEEYAKLMPPLFWENYRKNIVKSLDEKGSAQHIVAEYVGKIVGSVLLYPPAASAYGNATGEDVSVPEMRLLAVDPMMRGHGIGNALTRECVLRAQRAGAPALGLHTTDIMQTAMHMYERMGFVRTPELDFSSAKDAVIKAYRLPLGQDLVI